MGLKSILISVSRRSSPVIEPNKIPQINGGSVVYCIRKNSRSFRLNINWLQQLNLEGVVLQRHVSATLLIEDSNSDISFECVIEELKNFWRISS